MALPVVQLRHPPRRKPIVSSSIWLMMSNIVRMSNPSPLIFLSSNFVPTINMPRVLRNLADWNPISAGTSAWSLAFLVVLLPLSIRSYLAPTSR
jgi:hypothetical protein